MADNSEHSIVIVEYTLTPEQAKQSIFTGFHFVGHKWSAHPAIGGLVVSEGSNIIIQIRKGRVSLIHRRNHG